MAGVAIEQGSQLVSVGSTVELTAKADDASDATFSWQRDGQPVPGATEKTLRLSPVRTEDEGAYTVAMTKGGTTTTSPSVVLGVRGEALLEWDVGWSAAVLVVVGVLGLGGIAWPLFWALGTVSNRHDFPKDYPALVAVELLLVGAFLVVATIVVALIELRGRSRRLAEVPAGARQPRTAEPPAGGWSAVVAAAPEAIKAWGNLKVTAALLLAALGLFAGGATLAWNSTVKPASPPATPASPATPTTPTTTAP